MLDILEQTAVKSANGVTEKRVVVYLNQKRGWNVLPPELRGDVTKELGPSFLPDPSKSVCKGLNPHLERFLLPQFVGVSADSAEFPARANEYWNDWSMVAREEGTILNISTYKRKIQSAFNVGEEVEVDFPVEVDHFISYNMIMQNPKVAKTKEDLQNLENWDYYIIDLEEKEKQEISAFELESKAMLEYTKTISGEAEEAKEKILQILEVMKEPGEVFTSDMDIVKLKMALMVKAKLPAKQNSKQEWFHPFVKVATDSKLKIKAFIAKCVNLGIITKEGNNYYNGDESLGNLKQTILKLEEKTYSGELIKLQDKVKSFE